MRVTRDAGGAILSQQHLTATDAAGIGRHGVVVDAVINADESGGNRTGLGKIEAAGLAIWVIPEIDLNHPGF